jgi:adenine phosphoribosyltransferase
VQGLFLLENLIELPYETISASYDLEYGSDTLEIHVDAIQKETESLYDDVLATGGTAKAVIELVNERLGGENRATTMG